MGCWSTRYSRVDTALDASQAVVDRWSVPLAGCSDAGPAADPHRVWPGEYVGATVACDLPEGRPLARLPGALSLDAAEHAWRTGWNHLRPAAALRSDGCAGSGLSVVAL